MAPQNRRHVRSPAAAAPVADLVITDQNITSSRWPDDLPAFCARIVEQFAADWKPADRPGG
jgi:protease I